MSKKIAIIGLLFYSCSEKKNNTDVNNRVFACEFNSNKYGKACIESAYGFYLDAQACEKVVPDCPLGDVKLECSSGTIRVYFYSSAVSEKYYCDGLIKN